jgi:maleylpyruvate isomerase
MPRRLDGFFRCGTSHRVRIALNLQGPCHEQVAVDLRKAGHLSQNQRAINPQQRVPAVGIGKPF